MSLADQSSLSAMAQQWQTVTVHWCLPNFKLHFHQPLLKLTLTKIDTGQSGFNGASNDVSDVTNDIFLLFWPNLWLDGRHIALMIVIMV